MVSPAAKANIRIVEVGPRDGLQNVKQTIPTSTKLELIHRLRDAGLQTIEVTSIVSPNAIPQLADCRSVVSDAGIQEMFRDTTVRAPVLVPNLKGLDLAMRHNVREIAVFVSATEGFSKANINCGVQHGLDRARAVADRARQQGLAVRGCVFQFPFRLRDATVQLAKSLHLQIRLLHLRMSVRRPYTSCCRLGLRKAAARDGLLRNQPRGHVGSWCCSRRPKPA